MPQSDQSAAIALSDDNALGSRENWWGTDPKSDAGAEANDNTQSTATGPHSRSFGEEVRRPTAELVELTERWLGRYDLTDAEIEAVVDHTHRLKRNSHENNLSDVEILALAVDAAGVGE